MNIDYLKEQVRYADGELYWRVKRSGRSLSRPIGSLDKYKYKSIMIDGTGYRLHRVIYFLHSGEWPEIVDHINGGTLDNRIENLRASDAQTNNYNRSLDPKSKSGVKNVFWDKREGKWRVQVASDGKRKTIGYYDDLELAESIAIESRDKYHGAFARHL